MNPIWLSYDAHKSEIDAAIQRVLASGEYILGNEVRQFEQEFARYIGVEYGIGVATGTDALILALKACGVGKGDEVITVSHTAVATVSAIESVGATPVLVDINPDTFTMDAGFFGYAITNKTKAVIPVHLYGNPAKIETIVGIARDHDITVIEDCAQSHGALYNGKKTGFYGDVAAFSFYPTKNLGCIGDGGMVVTGNEDIAGNVRMLRQYGWNENRVSIVPGMNSRLDEIQAAILRVKLPYLDVENLMRRRIAHTYSKNLPKEFVTPPYQEPGTVHIYHQYVIRTNQRDALRDYLSQHGIPTAIHYPVPVHMHPAYKKKQIQLLPVTEKICTEIMSLPMHPYMDDENVRIISTLITRFFEGV